MAELQVTVPYKTLPSRVVFTVMCSLFPVWAILMPAALGFFIGSTLSHPGSIPAWATTWVLFTMLGFTLSSIAITAIAEDNRLHLSKDGVAFPPFLLPRMQ